MVRVWYLGVGVHSGDYFGEVSGADGGGVNVVRLSDRRHSEQKKHAVAKADRSRCLRRL